MRVIVTMTLLLLPLLSFAIPTGLNLMPTAETLSIGQSRFDYETEGSGKLYVPDGSSIVGTQIGFVLGLEGGVDQVSEDGTVYNAKWVFKGEGLVFPALAIGAQGISSDEETQYYAVATKTLVPGGLAKVHAGLLRDQNDDTVTMIGASGKLGPLTVKADRVNGGFRDAEAVSVGYALNGFLFTGTQYFYDEGEDETTLTVSYSYSPL